MAPCFECGAPADHDHHVVPRTLGGTKTVPLCAGCHSKIHDLGALLHQRELTRRSLARLRQEGRRCGTIPYGFQLGDANILVRDGAEQAVLTRIVAMRRGGRTLREIAQILTAESVPTKSGVKAWAAETVRKILLRPDLHDLSEIFT